MFSVYPQARVVLGYGCQWCGDASAGNLLGKLLVELIRKRLVGKTSFSFCQMAKPGEFYPG